MLKVLKILHYLYSGSRPEVFCRKVVLRIFAKLKGKHLCQRIFLIKLQALGVLKKRCSENIQQIYRSPVNLQHIFRTPFPKNTSGWLLLHDPLLSLRLLNQISMCWKWVSRKIPPENSSSWGVSGRVRARLGIKLGLGSGGFFPGGFNVAHNSKTIHVNPISR